MAAGAMGPQPGPGYLMWRLGYCTANQATNNPTHHRTYRDTPNRHARAILVPFARATQRIADRANAKTRDDCTDDQAFPTMILGRNYGQLGGPPPAGR